MSSVRPCKHAPKLLLMHPALSSLPVCASSVLVPTPGVKYSSKTPGLNGIPLNSSMEKYVSSKRSTSPQGSTCNSMIPPSGRGTISVDPVTSTADFLVTHRALRRTARALKAVGTTSVSRSKKSFSKPPAHKCSDRERVEVHDEHTVTAFLVLELTNTPKRQNGTASNSTSPFM